MKKFRRLLSGLLVFCMVLAMFPAEAIAVEKVPGEFKTNIAEQKFVVDVPTEFTFTTVANDDAGTMVVGYAEFNEPSAIKTLEYYEPQTDEWYPLEGEFGPATGFPMADATSTFRVTFNKAGTFEVKGFIKAVETGEIVCETEEITFNVAAGYQVTASQNIAEAGTIGLDADTIVKPGESVEFEVNANKNYVIYDILNATSKEIAENKKSAKVTVTPTADTEVKVVFARICKVLVNIEDGSGKVTAEGAVPNEDGLITAYVQDGKLNIQADAETGYRIATFKVTSGGGPNPDSYANETFNALQSSYAVELEAVRGYTVTVTFVEATHKVTFSGEGGSFTDAEGNALTELTADYCADVQFKFAASEENANRKYKIFAGGTELTADENGVYTIQQIKADTEVSVVFDMEAPEVTCAVAPEGWAQSKTITATVNDAFGSAVTVYMTEAQYENLDALIAAAEQPAAAGEDGKYTKTVTANGTYYVYAVDESGNLTEQAVVVEKIDTQKPTAVKVSTMNTVTQILYTVEAKDVGAEDVCSGVVQVYYTTNPDADFTKDHKEQEIYTAKYKDDGAWHFNVSKFENRKVYIFVMDKAGNIYSDAPAFVNIEIKDITVPEDWKQDECTVTFTAVAEGTAVEVRYSTNKYENVQQIKAEGASTKLVPVEENSNNYSVTVNKNGTYYIYAICGENDFAVDDFVVNCIDYDAPVIISVTKDPKAEWTNGAVTITVEASDSQSGIKAVKYGTDGEEYDGTAKVVDGKYVIDVSANEFNGTYYIAAEDGAGRLSVKTIPVKIDVTDPELSLMYGAEAQGMLAKVLNTLSFDLIFKEKVVLGIMAKEPEGSVASGVVKYVYSLKGVDKEGKEVKDSGEGEWPADATEHTVYLPFENVGDFVGKITVTVYDAAGNSTTAVADTSMEGGTTIVLDNEIPAAPAVNANGYTADQWTKEDVTITLSGGDTLSGVRNYQYRIVYADGTTQDWADMPLSTEAQAQKWKDNPNEFVYDKIVISADTNATYYFRTVSNTGNISEEVFVAVKVQKTLPANATLEIAGNHNGENEWYVGEYPTIAITEPTVDTHAAPVTTHYQLWNTTLGETQEGAEDVSFNGTNPEIKADGVYFLRIWTVDAAGNKCTDEAEILRELKVDITAPTELKMTIDDVDILDDDNSVTFNKFYSEAVTVKLDAVCDISGLESLLYQKVSAASDYEVNGTWTVYDGGIEVKPSEKFVIYFKAVDKAGNETIVNSTGIVVDNKAPQGEQNAPEIGIHLPEANENGIYTGDVQVTLNVMDPRFVGVGANAEGFYSGLQKITYRIYTKDTNAKVEGDLLDLTNKLTDGAEYDGDKLVNSWTGKITIDAEMFNSNNVIVEVTATDNAGNSRTTKTAEGQIKIDMTAPKIAVSYNLNRQDGFYNANRVATIIVTERNLDIADVLIAITRDGAEFTDYEISEWRTTAGTGNGDDTTHTATITYNTDGDYTFDISCTDLAGRTNEDVVYTGSTPTAFTIDKTNPVIRVSYNNNNAANGNYFNAARTATITITEHNFDEDLVVFTRTADRGGVNPAIAWAHNGDTHVATISYTTDGDYTFDVTMTDRAGNESGAANYGNSVAGRDFVIDTTYVDMITLGGVEDGETYDYEAEVIPTLEISDINLDEYTVTLTGAHKDEVIDLTQQVNALLQDDGQTVTGSFDIYEVIQDLDGIYTLTVTSQDMAGNRDSEELSFTVNRFGSKYVYSEYLMALIANGGAYVTGVTEDLIIREFNPSKLLTDSLVIEITCDGKPLENVIYDAQISDSATIGESGWYEYEYIISKDNFISDGVYKISVSSKDAAGNTPENNRYEDLVIIFRVDATLPEITSIVGLEEPIIDATEQEVKYTVYDTMGLKSVKIYVDGDLVDEITDFSEDPNNYTGSFVLKEKRFAQDVRIIVEDLTGNVTDTDAKGFSSAYEFNESVTVSTNALVRWFANKTVFWGSIGGGAGLLGILWFFLIAKRKKKEEDNVQ